MSAFFLLGCGVILSILFLLLGRRPTNWVADETNISSKDKSKERRMKTEGRMSKREKVQKSVEKVKLQKEEKWDL